MQIEPRGIRLYVVFDAVEEKQLKSGLWTPDMSSEPIRIGTVKAVGKNVTMYFVGERVAAQFHVGTDLVFKDVNFKADCHRIISESNILCVIHEENEEGAKGKSEVK